MIDMRSYFKNGKYIRILIVVTLTFVSFTQNPSLSVPASQPGAPSANRSIVHGAQIVPIYWYGTEILAFNNLVGKDVGIVMFFWSWQWTNANDILSLPNNLENTTYGIPGNRRPAIMISWIPILSAAQSGINQTHPSLYPECNMWQPDTSKPFGGVTNLDAIANGSCDRYIADHADQLKSKAPQVFLLRPMHEMNINASSWWAGYSGNNPNKFVAAWRRMHDVFVSRGATNVQWVWSPGYDSYPTANQPGYAWNDIHNYYPGNNYVDWVGPDGYNWGARFPGNPATQWLSFAQIFDRVLKDFGCRYPKPQMISEFGTVEGSRPGDGTKAQWISDAYSAMASYPLLHAAVWLNDFGFSDYSNPNAADFRVVAGTAYGNPDPYHVGTAYPLPNANNPVWTNVYKNAIAPANFTSRLPTLSDITPSGILCAYLPYIRGN
jgi:beta-mannanase